MQILKPRNQTMLAYATDPNLLRKFIPQVNATLETAANIRAAQRESAIPSNWGKLYIAKNPFESKLLALVPWPVMTALLAQEPDMLEDNGRKLLQWLDVHPGYKATE